jgi:hypothetical protein
MSSAAETPSRRGTTGAWAAYDAAYAAYKDAITAEKAALAAEKHQCELHNRMERWINRPDRITPYPWVGEEFVEPCNQLDFDYYAVRPDAYPPGVREWHARYQSFLYDGPCVCRAEWEVCTRCCGPPEPAPAAAAGVTMHELLHLGPDEKATVKATCARHDLTDAQKMAEIQRIVRVR